MSMCWMDSAGLEVLTAMERVPTDDDDRPTQDIKFKSATVFVNPFKEMEEAEKKQAEEERLKVGSCPAAEASPLLIGDMLDLIL